MAQKKTEQQKTNVFAIFKKYNTSTLNSQNNEKRNEKDKKNILPKYSNRYTYKGKLFDYDEYIQKKNTEKNPEDFEHLDYTTFKKLSKELDDKKIK